MDTRWAQVVRGFAAAAFATLAAAVSHSLAGGVVSALGLVIAMAFASFLSIALAGRSPSLPRLAASVAASQLAFHSLFAHIGTGSMVVANGHHSISVVSNVVTADATSPHSHGASGWMWAMHGLAALATIIALRRGEAAFWRFRELVLLVIASWRVPLFTPSRPVSLRVSGRESAPHQFLLRSAALRYRGPPAIRFA